MSTQAARLHSTFIILLMLAGNGFAQSGIISTVAGNGEADYSGDGQQATTAEINAPYGLVVDREGNLFIADTYNHRIRKVTPQGVINTVAGLGTPGYSGDGGRATSAQIDSVGLAMDLDGNLFIGEPNNHRVRKVTPQGIISTVAGNGTPGGEGDGGRATSAQLSGPRGIAVDSAGNLFIAESYGNRVRKVTPGGIISTIAGDGNRGFGGDGGPAVSAQLNNPYDVAVDSAGNLYIADSGNQRVRKVTPAGVISTVAGNGLKADSDDSGLATSARLSGPTGVVVDTAGNLFIAENDGHRVRKVAPAGMISTVAGDGTADFGGDGGPATSAQLNGPWDVTVDTAGSLYIGERYNHRVRKVTAVSSVDTFFPQVAVGGGYSTLFTIINTGSAAAAANLILRDPQGDPFPVNGTLIDASGTTQPALAADSFSFTVPSGGTVFLNAAGEQDDDQIKTGWAQLQNTEGLLTGVATYEYAVDSIPQLLVGIRQSERLQYATIPVDNDENLYKQVAYAIANPTPRTISVKLTLVAQDGKVIDDSVRLTLEPGQQVARYLYQELDCRNFKGSLILQAQNGATFFAIALLEKQGLLTVTPMIPGKAPGLTD